jgi:hypothetical protein
MMCSIQLPASSYLIGWAPQMVEMAQAALERNKARGRSMTMH